MTLFACVNAASGVRTGKGCQRVCTEDGHERRLGPERGRGHGGVRRRPPGRDGHLQRLDLLARLRDFGDPLYDIHCAQSRQQHLHFSPAT